MLNLSQLRGKKEKEQRKRSKVTEAYIAKHLQAC